jgi:hypothetical protein
MIFRTRQTPLNVLHEIIFQENIPTRKHFTSKRIEPRFFLEIFHDIIKVKDIVILIFYLFILESLILLTILVVRFRFGLIQ